MSRDHHGDYLKHRENILMTAAELYDLYGEKMKPILDRAEREYLAAKNKISEVDRIKKMIAD